MKPLALLLALAGCGSAPASFGDGVVCGTNITCPGDKVCCVGSATGYTCESSCVEKATVRCDEPSDCGSQFCCITFNYLPTPSTERNCRYSGEATCASRCVWGQNGSGCAGTEVFRVCVSDADCAGDPTHPRCCGSGSIKLCQDIGVCP